jgi:WD40 repeat protein/3',5'-cyclic AMP phosphodiesterase CpdA
VSTRGSITLLHLSDLQFGRHHRFGNLGAGDPDAPFDTLLARLEEDLELLRRKEPHLQPEAIVVSGDLVEWGLRSELSDAHEFLRRLAAALEIPHRNVVMVPGNHDVNRKLCEAYFSECEADERTPAPPYARKWEPYLRMFEEFYADDPEIAFTVEEPWTLWQIESLNLVVAGLNSTLAESHRDADHYGLVGEEQLRRFAERLKPYAERGWFRLGVVHHNPIRGPVADDENLRDAEQLGRLLAPSLDLLLHGHTHNGEIAWLGDRPLPVLSAGSAALKDEARPQSVPNQYQLIRLHGGGIERWMRRYDPPRKRWVADTSASPDGDSWKVFHQLEFQRGVAIFSGAAAADPRSEGVAAGEADLRLDEREDFASRVMEVCVLRHGGADVQIEAMPSDPSYPYLRVSGRDGGVAQSFPIGLAAGNVSKERLDGFCEVVFDRYRALDPSLRCTIVYGGDHAPEEIVRAASARNVELRSFVEFQGIIDFRGYVVRQTARLESDAVYPPAMYVPQRLVYEVGAERHDAPDAIAQMVTWLQEPRSRFVLVLGDFGTGKTFMLRELARRMSAEVPHLVPVLLELRSLEKARTIEQLVAQHLATAGERFIDLEAFPYMLRKGRIALLVDGFDELAVRVTYKRATEHFDSLLQAAGGDAKIVLTSRTQHFESDHQARSAMLERAELLPGLSLCHLQPFDDEQILTFLERRLGDEQKARERFDLIDEIKDLLGLSHNPRMLDFIAGIPEERLREARGRTGEITAAELYRLLIDQWLEYEWDKTQHRGVAPALTREQRLEAVTELALALWGKLDRTVHVSELTEQVSVAVESLSIDVEDLGPVDPDAMAHLIGSRTLLVRDEEGSFEFVHASVMEWFVANRAAAELSPRNSPEVLGQGEMTKLMAEFFCDLAGHDRAAVWARGALGAGEPGPGTSNALLVLDRLGEEAVDASFAGESLSGTDLSKRNLAGASFRGADLTEARAAEVDLSDADLSQATLVGADLTRAVLRGAKLCGADMRGVRLLGGDLRDADVTGANLRRAKLIGAQGADPKALAGADTFGAALPGAGTPEAMLAAVASPATAAAFHPIDEVLASGHKDGSVRLWDPRNGVELRSLFGHWGWVPSVCFSPDGSLLVSAGSDSTVRIWDVLTGVEVRALVGHRSGVRDVAFSPDGKLLATAGEDGTVRIWSAHSGVELHTLTGHQGWVRGVAFSPDGNILASGGSDDHVRLWDPAGGFESGLLPGHRSGTWHLAFSPDGSILASGGSDDTVRLWQVASGAHVAELSDHRARVRRVAFSPDGAFLASVGEDSTGRIWTGRGTPVQVISDLEGRMSAIAFSADGGLFVAVGNDGRLRLLDLNAGSELASLGGRECEGAPAIAFAPDGRLLACGAKSATIQLWNPAMGLVRRTVYGATMDATDIAFSLDGDLLAAADRASGVRIWRIDGDPASQLDPELVGRVNGVAFSPDGSMLASAGQEVHLWDLESRTRVAELSGHQARVRQVYFSSDGKLLASAEEGSTVHVFDLATRRALHRFSGQWLGVRKVAFSPDSRFLAGAFKDSLVRGWDLASGTQRFALSGHRGSVNDVAFSPGGQLLASAGDDSTVRIWDFAGGVERYRLYAHQGSVREVAFSRDGKQLASAGEDGTVRIWDPEAGTLLVTLVDLGEGWVAFAPDGRYKSNGRIGGAFWQVLGLCRFALGELDDFVPPAVLRRLGPDESL